MINDRRTLNESLGKRRMLFLSEISEYRVDEIMIQLMALNLESNREIRMIINSDGGDIDSGLQLYDAMKMTAKITPITGIVVGKCYSAALVILQACHRRQATKHSSFLCHFVSQSVRLSARQGFKTKLDMSLEKMRISQKFSEQVLRERTKLSPKEILRLMEEGEKYGEITAEKAHHLGFIDEIIDQYPEV